MTNIRKVSATTTTGTTFSQLTDVTVQQFTETLPQEFLVNNTDFTVTETELPVDAEGNPEFVWKFFWSVGRMGDLESYFVASQKTVDNLYGKSAYFGEVLGKHSEVEGQLEKTDFTLITKDIDVVAFFKKVIGSTGHNPLDYLNEEEDYED